MGLDNQHILYSFITVVINEQLPPLQNKVVERIINFKIFITYSALLIYISLKFKSTFLNLKLQNRMSCGFEILKVFELFELNSNRLGLDQNRLDLTSKVFRMSRISLKNLTSFNFIETLARAQNVLVFFLEGGCHGIPL